MFGQSIGPTGLEVAEKFQVQMRAAPTGTVISGSEASFQLSSGSPVDNISSAPGVANLSTNTFALWTQMTGFSGVTTNVVAISRKFSAGVWLLLSAEL